MTETSSWQQRGIFRCRPAGPIITVPPALAGRLRYHPPLPALRDHLMQCADALGNQGALPLSATVLG